MVLRCLRVVYPVITRYRYWGRCCRKAFFCPVVDAEGVLCLFLFIGWDVSSWLGVEGQSEFGE